jgi:hypothetical protein
MTTSYRLEAIKELRAQKKLDREAEAVALSEARKAAEIAHQANMARIAEKEARIASGQPAPEPAPEPETAPEPEVEEAVAEAPKKKPAAKKKATKSKKSK